MTATAPPIARYSPAEVVSAERVPVIGDPDPRRICISLIDRQNLTMRTQMRRLTRSTNGFSKKWRITGLPLLFILRGTIFAESTARCGLLLQCKLELRIASGRFAT